MIRRLHLAVGAALAILPAGALFAQRPDPSARFIGTWRLVSIDSASALRNGHGFHPTGLIMYDATGHMAAQIQPDRRRVSWAGRSPTAHEALDAALGYVAYFGTYRVDEQKQTVTHHREGALNFDAVDYVRRFEFQNNGERLLLMPVDRPGMRLVWERIKP